MTQSYKHIRFVFDSIYRNNWTHFTQFYRTSLYINTHYITSLIYYKSSNHNISNKIASRASYLSFFLSKFIYSFVKYLKLYSYLLKFFKKIRKVNSFKKKKIVNLKIYNRLNKFLFKKKLYHFILFFKKKIKNKMKKQRYLMWKCFYEIPSNFWTLSKKKRMKSFIWRLLNSRIYSKNIYKKKNINKKNNLRGKLFFFSINKIANLIHTILKKKRFPRKKWFILKKKKKKKFFIKKKATMNLWIRYFLNTIMIQNKKKKSNVFFLNSIFNNNISKNVFFSEHFSNSKKNISFSYFFVLYCYFIYTKYYYKKNKFNFVKFDYLSVFYNTFSSFLRDKKDVYLIRAGIVHINLNFFAFSYHKLYIKLNNWFEIFFLDRDLNLYFIINRLFSINGGNNDNFFTLYFKKHLYILFFYKTIKYISKDITLPYFYFQYNKSKFSGNLDTFKEDVNTHINYINNLYKRTNWKRICFLPYMFSIKINKNKRHQSNNIIQMKKMYIFRKKILLNIYRSKIRHILMSRSNNKLSFINKQVLNEKNKKRYNHNKFKYKVKRMRQKIKIKKIKKQLKNIFSLFSFYKKYLKLDASILFLSALAFISKKKQFFNKPTQFKKKKETTPFSYYDILLDNKFVENKLIQYNNPSLYYLLDKNKKKKIKKKKDLLKKKIYPFFFYKRIKNKKNIFYKKLIKKKKNLSISYILFKKKYFFIKNKYFKKKLILLLKKLYYLLCKKKEYSKQYLLKNKYMYLYSVNKMIHIKKKKRNKKIFKKKDQEVSGSSSNNLLFIDRTCKKKNNNYFNLKKINLFIYENRYLYLLDNNKYVYLKLLWENRKKMFFNQKRQRSNNIKSKNQILRFLLKKQFIFKYYYLNSNIYKELFSEYSIRLYYNNGMNEFERNFSRLGPLSFYHKSKELSNIGTVKNGINIINNIIFKQSMYNIIKPFLLNNIVSDYTGVILYIFFSPLKNIYYFFSTRHYLYIRF